MAAGRIIVPSWMPAVDSDGVPIPNARMFFYENETTTLATVYADMTLTTPLTNPVPADSSGQFPPIWADDANLFSVTVDAPYGPPGQPFTFDDIGPSTSSNTSAANKADLDGGNFTNVDQATFLANAGTDTLFNQNSVLAYIPVEMWAGIAAQTLNTDLTSYIQAAIDTGKDIVFPAGRYRINQLVLNTPRQRLICLSWDTIFRQLNPTPQPARPMLIFNPSAVAATVEGGTWDQNSTLCTNPVLANGDIATGSAILMMADYCRMINPQVLNGWDNGISLYQVNLSTGIINPGKPVAPAVYFARTENCGVGIRTYAELPPHQAGSGINNLTAASALVFGCIDFSSRTNFIADYGGGASGSFENCTGYFAKLSTGALDTGGWGVYNGTGDYRWKNIQIIECQRDGVWIDGYSQNVEGDFYIKAAWRRAALIQGRNNSIHVTANACSFGQPNQYDAIEIRGTADVGGTFTNSTGLELLNPTVYGAEHRYAIATTSDGGRTVTGSSVGGYLQAGMTGLINNTQNGFTVNAVKTSERAGYSVTIGRGDFQRACDSYLTAPFGDSAGNGTFFVSSGANKDKRIAMGYDDTNDCVVAQAIHAGIANKTMRLNPSGGAVQAGKGSWDQGPLLLGSYYLWVDPFGKLRIKNSAPTFGEDGTVVGAQT